MEESVNMFLDREEVICLYALVLTSNEGLIDDAFCFDNYAEQRICLNKNNDIWQVYGCERGNKFDIRTFDDCKKACVMVIWECSYTKEDMEIALQYFLSIIQNGIMLSDDDINIFMDKYRISKSVREGNKKLVKNID